MSSRQDSGSGNGRKLLIVRNFEAMVRRSRLVPLPVTIEHALRAGTFAGGHGDPFGRLLAAQARIEAAPIISGDIALAAFPIERIRDVKYPP